MRDEDVALDSHCSFADAEPQLKEYQSRNQVEMQPLLSIRGNCGRDKVIATSVIDEHSLTRECFVKSLETLCPHLDVTAFPSFDDCLLSDHPHRLILYSVYDNIARRGDKYRLAITKLQNLAPVIILSDVDCNASISMAFKSGARGYIPTTNTSLEVAIQIIHLVTAGGTFVPLCSLSTPGVNWQPAIRGANNTLQFTQRQMAVLGCLQVGKSNKMIAHQLAMSESTVKVHIRNIMKKLNASNRTEVACRAYELGMSDIHATH